MYRIKPGTKMYGIVLQTNEYFELVDTFSNLDIARKVAKEYAKKNKDELKIKCNNAIEMYGNVAVIEIPEMNKKIREEQSRKHKEEQNRKQKILDEFNDFIKNGVVENVKKYIEKYKSYFSRAVIHDSIIDAINYGQINIIKFMFEKYHSDEDIFGDYQRQDFLNSAFITDYYEIYEFFISKGILIDKWYSNYKDEAVEFILNNGNKTTPNFLAEIVYDKNTKHVKRLVKSGASVKHAYIQAIKNYEESTYDDTRRRWKETSDELFELL